MFNQQYKIEPIGKKGFWTEQRVRRANFGGLDFRDDSMSLLEIAFMCICLGE